MASLGLQKPPLLKIFIFQYIGGYRNLRCKLSIKLSITILLLYPRCQFLKNMTCLGFK